jgi:hypothetical protein
VGKQESQEGGKRQGRGETKRGGVTSRVGENLKAIRRDKESFGNDRRSTFPNGKARVQVGLSRVL